MEEWLTPGCLLWCVLLHLNQSLLKADLSSDTLAFRLFIEVKLRKSEDFNFVSVWNATVMMNRANAMLTDVHTTALCPHSMTVVVDAKIPRLRKKEYSMTFRYHDL